MKNTRNVNNATSFTRLSNKKWNKLAYVFGKRCTHVGYHFHLRFFESSRANTYSTRGLKRENLQLSNARTVDSQ